MGGKKRPTALVEAVIPGSVAARLGIESGDMITGVNGRILRDIIDYQLFTAEERLAVAWETPEGEAHSAEVTKDCDEDLGISFASAVFDGIRLCRNRCAFCFVDQMPRDRRKTLYVKDDDYRLSFLYGNYITLTNLTEADFQRIIEDRLSPLYISIHAVDPALRARLLGMREKMPLLENLARLAAGRIRMHGQIVLCPGINDGDALKETVEAIAALGEAFESLALVPVGLTRFQDDPGLRPYHQEEAAAVLAALDLWQKRFLAARGSRFVFAADEFYLLAGREVPPESEYEGYPQIENGVGLIRQFWEDYDYERERLPKSIPAAKEIKVITSVDGAKAIGAPIASLNEIANLTAATLTVENRFFGPTVTVTGLLTAGDIVAKLKREDDGARTYLLPDVLLKHGETILLDDRTVVEMEKDSGQAIDIVPADAAGLVDYVCGLAKERKMV